MLHPYRTFSVVAVFLFGCAACFGGTRQWTDGECVPPFRLASGDTIEIYEVDWFDRDIRYTKFNYPTNELLLCLQPQNWTHSWCERRAVNFYTPDVATPSRSIRVRKLPSGSVVQFDGSVSRTRNWGIQNLDGGSSPASYFRGKLGHTTVWLSGADLLHLIREVPEVADSHGDVLDAIGARKMLELYREGDNEGYGLWRCTQEDADAA